MPFDTENKVVYGEDARKVATWARETFCTWLAAKLNDPEGAYANDLKITAQRQAVVTDNGPLQKQMYSAPESPPLVTVIQGPIERRLSGKKIGGVSYSGTRYEISLTLDMAVRDTEPLNDDKTKEVRDDSLLASFVADAIERGLSELDALGLFNSNLKADLENQRAGVGRNPHTFTFFTLGLDDWALD